MHAACKRLIVATHMHGFSLQLSLVVYTTLIPSRKLVLYTCSTPPYIACPKLGHDRALQSTTLCNLHEFLKLEKQTTNAWQQTKSLTDEENRLFGVYVCTVVGIDWCWHYCLQNIPGWKSYYYMSGECIGCHNGECMLNIAQKYVANKCLCTILPWLWLVLQARRFLLHSTDHFQ